MADASATARVTLEEPAALLDRLCAHFAEHGRVTRQAGKARFDGHFGSLDITLDVRALHVTASSPDETRLFVVKSSFADHLVAFAGDEMPDLLWQGDVPKTIPYFREMAVRGACDITPAMRRVTLSCADVEHFETGGLHVRVLIPPRGRAPCWPRVGADCRVLWPKDEDALVCRVYTIRSIDRDRGEVAIDVVLHDDSAGSAWARAAGAGDRVGLMGPGGGNVIATDRYLLAGDETALPAIARILETLPATAEASIVIEVAGPAEEQSLPSAARLDLHWLHRDGRPAGSTDLLPQAVRHMLAPRQVAPYVFVGCEAAAARSIRKYLRVERGFPKEGHLVAAYWRHGHAQAPDGDD